MTAPELALAAVRLLALLAPLVLAGVRAARRSALGSPPARFLLGATVSTGILLLAAELLGALSLLRWWVLTVVLWGVALAAGLLARPASGRLGPPRPVAPTIPRGARTAVGLILAIVLGQWLLATADSLGSGMLSFDTLWYHMPFAARFAQTGSTTAIQFTQADAYTAYFPAGAELLHAVGILALGNDLLSPLLNLGWLGLALLACWCFGERWGVPWLTLAGGATVLAMPVMGATQPGQAFNDIVGLAGLLAAAALLVNGGEDPLTLVAAGLALGLAVATKYTFLVPALCLLAGRCLLGGGGGWRRGLGLVGAPLLAGAGWWYARNWAAVGNPIGLRVSLGPLTLPGPRSVLAQAAEQTVFSALRHLSLWGSRFWPGLVHALGPLWPLVLVIWVLGLAWAARPPRDASVCSIAVAGVLAAVTYAFLPTGGTGLSAGTVLFEVNLRYAVPALALGLLLAAVAGARVAPARAGKLPWLLLLIVVAMQLERPMWPSRPARHAAFLAAAAAAVWAGWWIAHRPARGRWRRRAWLPLAVTALVLAAAAVYVIQRHYFDQRYRRVLASDPALGEIFSWAQTVAHARVAVYGTVEQYPLYGARDTNAVDYLGRPAADGAFAPIADCRTWRAAIDAGSYRYVVLTPAPTAAVPLAWTLGDPSARVVFHPAALDYVVQLEGAMHPGACPAP